MMLKEFTLLEYKEKISILYEHGVYIGKRRLGKNIAVLYQLEGFYVELLYRKYRCFIESIHCFTGTARLDPYLTEINVEHLV